MRTKASEFVDSLKAWGEQRPKAPEVWTAGGGSVPLAHITERGALYIHRDRDDCIGPEDARRLARFIDEMFG